LTGNEARQRHEEKTTEKELQGSSAKTKKAKRKKKPKKGKKDGFARGMGIM